MKPRLKVRDGRIMPSELPIHQPDTRLIHWMETQLKLAKSGDLIAIAGVAQYSDGGVQNVWSMAHPGVQRYRMAGSLFGLMNELTFPETGVADRLMWVE